MAELVFNANQLGAGYIFPCNGQQLAIISSFGYSITGTSIGNGYTKLVTNTQSDAINRLIIGYGNYQLETYNNPATFGGQVTPVTGYLTTASDDSWEMRNKPTALYGTYQLTTQVPTQNLPLMTHLYAVEEAATGALKSGLWKISYVIDNNSIIIYDPQGTAVGSWGNSAGNAICQNQFTATNINLQAPAGATIKLYTSLQQNITILGPFNIDFVPNQNGIVEPFLMVPTAGATIVTITY